MPACVCEQTDNSSPHPALSPPRNGCRQRAGPLLLDAYFGLQPPVLEAVPDLLACIAQINHCKRSLQRWQQEAVNAEHSARRGATGCYLPPDLAELQPV